MDFDSPQAKKNTVCSMEMNICAFPTDLGWLSALTTVLLCRITHRLIVAALIFVPKLY